MFSCLFSILGSSQQKEKEKKTETNPFHAYLSQLDEPPSPFLLSPFCLLLSLAQPDGRVLGPGAAAVGGEGDHSVRARAVDEAGHEERVGVKYICAVPDGRKKK